MSAAGMDSIFAAPGGLLSLPLPLSGGSGEGPKPLLKSTSLSRLDELQQYLRQCDDQQYIRRYYKMLSSCPGDVLDDYANQLKNRAVWLATEEQREYQRAKLLNVMGGPAAPTAAAPDADAFCNEVLERDYPDDQCVTPHVKRHAALRRDPTLTARPEATPAPGSSQRAAAGTGGGGVGAACGGGSLDTLEGNGAAAAALLASPLFSPLAHVTLIDHHLRHISPFPGGSDGGVGP